jgi:ceramide glucosyltransferase
MLHFFQITIALLAVLGTLFYLIAIYSALAFLISSRRARRKGTAFTPPVTLLKPVRGTDLGAYECFRSHCVQDYPEYEIIFGVGDENDPAIPLIEKLMAEFPERKIRLIVCSKRFGMNRKLNNVLQMLPEARYQHFVLNDGDIQVPHDYLRRVMAPLADEKVGLVTCLYNAVHANTLGSRLEAVGIATDFAAGVLTSRQLEGGVHFGLGSTLAFSQKSLESIGGLEPLLDYIADDYQLGRRISAAGYTVVLGDVSVETWLPAYSFSEFFSHQLRWARSTRNSRPWGYLGLLLTFGLPWAIIAALLAPGAPWSLDVLAVALGARLLMAFTVDALVLRDKKFLGKLALVPLRDLVALVLWFTSYGSHEVSWRGSSFVLEKGKIRPVA